MAQPPVDERRRRSRSAGCSGSTAPARRRRETLAGQPLQPVDDPERDRLRPARADPVFLVLALSSDDRHDPLPVIIYAVIGWADYLDGIAARVTGQYSRLGTLLDPLVDRLLIIAGVVVCWHFELLPRWALALLAARELFMLVLVRARACAAGST